jgi:hypothetical protein
MYKLNVPTSVRVIECWFCSWMDLFCNLSFNLEPFWWFSISSPESLRLYLTYWHKKKVSWVREASLSEPASLHTYFHIFRKERVLCFGSGLGAPESEERDKKNLFLSTIRNTIHTISPELRKLFSPLSFWVNLWQSGVCPRFRPKPKTPKSCRRSHRILIKGPRDPLYQYIYTL